MQPRLRDASPRTAGAAARAAAVGLLLLAAPPRPAAGQPAEAGPLPRPLPVLAAIDPRAEADLFAMPAIAEASRAAAELAQAGDPAAAAGLLDAVIADHPDLGAVRAMRAGVAMLAGDPATALADLAAAAEHGADLGPLADDPLFAPLHADPRFRELAAPPGAAADARAGARPGRERPRPGLGRQHRLGPGHRAADRALSLPGRDRRRRPAAAAEDRRPGHPARALGRAAAPPATAAISTTTATAAIRR